MGFMCFFGGRVNFYDCSGGGEVSVGSKNHCMSYVIQSIIRVLSSWGVLLKCYCGMRVVFSFLLQGG